MTRLGAWQSIPRQDGDLEHFEKLAVNQRVSPRPAVLPPRQQCSSSLPEHPDCKPKLVQGLRRMLWQLGKETGEMKPEWQISGVQQWRGPAVGSALPFFPSSHREDNHMGEQGLQAVWPTQQTGCRAAG